MRFQCPLCKGVVSVEDADMGSTVQCGHCNKSVPVPASRTAAGSVIGDFIILREIGRGGMGIVYLAHQISLDRPAALKILADSYAKNAEFVVGFIKEARAAAKLNHPNIVQAYAVGDDEGIFYFAMEHVDGETMKNILKREGGLLTVDKAIDIIRQIAEALDYAWHEEKLVHRDIKPDNIMLTSTGRAKLADLGLAKVGNDSGKTDSEEVMGTPQYISPEQLTGDALDNRTDIYCLGATFYQFLTGQFPFNGATPTEIARQHLEAPLIPPSQVNPAVPEEVSNVVVKMMEKDPARRYQTAGELAEELTQIKHGKSPAGGKAAPKISVPKISVPKVAPPPRIPTPAAAPEAPKPKIVPKPVKMPAMPPQPAPAQPAPVPPPRRPVKAPAMPPQPAPAQPASSTPQPPVKKKKVVKSSAQGPQQSTGKKVVKIVVGVVVVILLAVAGWVCYVRFVKHEDPMAQISQVTEDLAKRNAKPEPTPFMKAAAPVVEAVRHSEGGDQKMIIRQCYDFLKTRLEPGDEEEKRIQQEIVEYFSNRDEEPIETARVKKVEEYEAEQERKRLAAAEEQRRKQEEERRAREREVEQKLKAEEKAASERKVNAFKNQIAAKERKMVLDLVRYAEKQDADGLRNALEQVILDVKDAPREFASLARPLATRAAALRKTMETAWAWERIFTSGDPALIGMQIELQGNLCKVTEIRDGVIHAKNLSGKEYTAEVRKLLRNKKFQQFTINAAIKLKKKDTLPFYYFWMNEFYGAYIVSDYASPNGKRNYSQFVAAYLAMAKQDSFVRSGLAEKFKGVPEFSGGGASSSKAPARKAAPAKKGGAKAPAKKAAPAKKGADKKAPAKKKAKKK
ncbi:MAG: protein kinase [Lentisphaeria bacterium]|nr:protein kinase [Lentisphaeria bacterium]